MRRLHDPCPPHFEHHGVDHEPAWSRRVRFSAKKRRIRLAKHILPLGWRNEVGEFNDADLSEPVQPHSQFQLIQLSRIISRIENCSVAATIVHLVEAPVSNPEKMHSKIFSFYCNKGLIITVGLQFQAFQSKQTSHLDSILVGLKNKRNKFVDRTCFHWRTVTMLKHVVSDGTRCTFLPIQASVLNFKYASTKGLRWMQFDLYEAV